VSVDIAGDGKGGGGGGGGGGELSHPLLLKNPFDLPSRLVAERPVS